MSTTSSIHQKLSVEHLPLQYGGFFIVPNHTLFHKIKQSSFFITHLLKLLYDLNDIFGRIRNNQRGLKALRPNT
ncbi:hypothetical protein MNL12_06875 [Bartonella krasnovii]|uniref:hypothetical protein n=1 Tax=Bartonella krasnovii TaxID=2267275 RepID=UPI001F4C617B|nr:hypothetical protein [Bartonella krasnovii]UNF35292.1 hypothetical protein MNL12_06875 [Bartonella krasnovii]UNF48477.1 hypothetical protein MNL04_07210 [Bartonella krasnovii]